METIADLGPLAKDAVVPVLNVVEQLKIKIYEDRPDTCKSFYCMWLIDPTLGPEWKPEKSHFVVALDLITRAEFETHVPESDCASFLDYLKARYPGEFGNDTWQNNSWATRRRPRDSARRFSRRSHSPYRR